jgi:hypothetical protein
MKVKSQTNHLCHQTGKHEDVSFCFYVCRRVSEILGTVLLSTHQVPISERNHNGLHVRMAKPARRHLLYWGNLDNDIFENVAVHGNFS